MTTWKSKKAKRVRLPQKRIDNGKRARNSCSGTCSSRDVASSSPVVQRAPSDEPCPVGEICLLSSSAGGTGQKHGSPRDSRVDRRAFRARPAGGLLGLAGTSRQPRIHARVSDLAACHGVDVSSIIPRLKTLERGGFIERASDPHDARVSIITLGSARALALETLHSPPGVACPGSRGNGRPGPRGRD